MSSHSAAPVQAGWGRDAGGIWLQQLDNLGDGIIGQQEDQTSPS